MRHLVSNILIVSSSLIGLSDTENKKRHSELTKQLISLSIPHEEVISRYKNSTIEYSILIDAKYRRVADMIVREYDQECYLEQHNDRSCELIFRNGVKEKIGQLKEVTKEKALNEASWTKTSNDKYFITG